MKIFNLLRKVKKLIGNKYKVKLTTIFFISIIASIFEIVSIALIAPLVSLATTDGTTGLLTYLPDIQLISSLNENTLKTFLLYTFLLSYFLGVITRFAAQTITIRTSFKIGTSLSSKIYTGIFDNFDYQDITNQDSSKFLAGASVKVNNVINGIINPLLNLVINTILLIGIIFALLVVNASGTIYLICALALVYLAIAYSTKNYKIKLGKIAAFFSTESIKLLKESLSTSREILIYNARSDFERKFKNAESNLRNSQAKAQITAIAPRYFIEAAVGLAAFLIIMKSNADSFITILPSAAAFLLALQKALPYMQNIYQAVSAIEASNEMLNDVLKMTTKTPKHASIEDSDDSLVTVPSRNILSISWQNLMFMFDEKEKNELSFLDCSVQKGESLLIKGPSGTGKSTLLNLIMGFYRPTSGCILFNGINTNELSLNQNLARISYVPQRINLINASIIDNIIIGNSYKDIDYVKLKYALEKSKVDDFFNDISEDELVGEAGISLSGGQIQRIGIARALYKDCDVIILDEATSGLNQELELKVIKNLLTLKDKIIIMITHNENLTSLFDKTYNLEEVNLTNSTTR